MKIKNFLAAMSCLFMGVFALTGCGSDSVEIPLPEFQGAVTVDKVAYTADNSSCTDGKTETFFAVKCFFESILENGDDRIFFAVRVQKDQLEELAAGQDVSAITGVDSYFSLTEMYVEKFDVLGGKVVVKQADEDIVILQFTDFRFRGQESGTEHILSGTVEYMRIDKDVIP